MSLGFSLGVPIQDVLGWMETDGTKLNPKSLIKPINPATEISRSDRAKY